MKPIKILTIVIAVFIGGLLLSSCRDEANFNDLQDSPIQDNKETVTSTTKWEVGAVSSINQAELDAMKSILENLKKQVEESSNQADKHEIEIENLKDQESSNRLCLLISIILGIISLVIGIIALLQVSKFSKRLNKLGNDIYNLKQSLDNRFSPSPMTRQNTSDDYYQLKSRLKILENEVKTLKRSKNTVDAGCASLYTPKPASAPIPVIETKKGYFGQPTWAERGYFTNFFTTRDSEARFSAKEKDNIAEFEPLLTSQAELGTLLCTEASKLAVEFKGCSPQEANQARVTTPGIAKFEGNRWYIIQKAIVDLSK